MKFKLSNAATLLILTSVLLTGCSSTDEQTEGFVDETAGIEKTENGVTTEGLGENSFSGTELNGGNGTGGSGSEGAYANGKYPGSDGAGGSGGPGGTKVIYFMLDSSQVQEEFVPVIAQHAQSLKSNPGQHIIVQGHTDERGSREYNVALGEQRAKTVARMLTLQGVPESQVETVSYGEEKPADGGHDESAWQLNRRAELDYQGQ